ncbi:hypothetical protein SAY86_007777 [Trapa natans]|uniref:Uncharacterized protein n=1 Tax=Trapa natans TaxID=22666 RepID=A0AAN7L8X6_TRANT|nr:hypothetical protein SAY86_007777 [Trapa natans]
MVDWLPSTPKGDLAGAVRDLSDQIPYNFIPLLDLTWRNLRGSSFNLPSNSKSSVAERDGEWVTDQEGEDYIRTLKYVFSSVEPHRSLLIQIQISPPSDPFHTVRHLTLVDPSTAPREPLFLLCWTKSEALAPESQMVVYGSLVGSDVCGISPWKCLI